MNLVALLICGECDEDGECDVCLARPDMPARNARRMHGLGPARSLYAASAMKTTRAGFTSWKPGVEIRDSSA